MTYAAPLQDMHFVLNHVVGLDRVAQLPGFAEVEPDLVEQVLGEAGRLASEVIAPLNSVGDREGSRLDNGVVRTATGFRAAYDQFVAGGWNGVPFDAAWDGQGLPWVIATAVSEMIQSANLSFSLCPLLTQGAIDLLEHHGSAEQKAIYLKRLVRGTWTGTMNLTEPQAGSDVGAVKTRAMPEGDHYRITGQKIYITYGEHDLAENIVHMVLARLPDAPAGVKGISLFLVPKFIPNADGALGPRNDLRCVSVEHKLGINASPTCVMSFGDDGGAIGWLIGAPHRGLEYMFTMMNNARLSVGLQGLAIAERAYQQARRYAFERVQGRALRPRAGEQASVIARHPDVRRMLLDMRSQIEAMRALAYEVAFELDRARRTEDGAERARAQARVDFLIPVVKGWCTDLGVEIASTGVQIHGGMGFIEETGAAQHYRDARILPIYEGTNGIQANDLVARKLIRDGGGALRELTAEIAVIAAALGKSGHADAVAIARPLAAAAEATERAAAWMIASWTQAVEEAAAGASPFLRLMGALSGGWMLGRSAIAASEALPRANGSAEFLTAKLLSARHFAEHVLTPATALADVVIRGGGTVARAEDFAL